MLTSPRHRSSTMTSQERVNRMFARQEQDRVPRHDSFWGETIMRWETEGLVGKHEGALAALGSDFASLCWLWPVVNPGRNDLVSEDELTRVIVDGQGKRVRYWKHKSGTPEHLGFECDTREAWETRFKPQLLRNAIQIDPVSIRSAYLRERERGRWTHLTGVESFEETRSLMGDEIALTAMAEDPEWIIDVSRTFTDIMLQNLDLAMSTGIKPDGLWIYGDMAFKTATMCSPAMYRELIWPDHKRMADWAHARGMKFIFHTDGDVNGVLDLYLEAGFDCLQPLEAKANMDIRNLCPKYGERLAFFGNIDVMVMATNDLAQIEAEISSKFAAAKETRGYAYHSDHSVPPTVSWKTYQEIIRMVEKYGRY